MLGSLPMWVPNWTPAEQSLPHLCADSGAASRAAWPPNFSWPRSWGRLSIAMPGNCACTRPLKHHDLLLSPTKPFLFLFFRLLALVFGLLSVPCLCMYIRGLYFFYERFLVNMLLAATCPLHTQRTLDWQVSPNQQENGLHATLLFSSPEIHLESLLCRANAQACLLPTDV